MPRPRCTPVRPSPGYRAGRPDRASTGAIRAATVAVIVAAIRRGILRGCVGETLRQGGGALIAQMLALVPALVPALVSAFVPALMLVATPAAAQFNPTRVQREADPVAARFPDPPVRYETPGLRTERAGFPSHAEVIDYLQGLRGPRLAIETIGRSQDGRPMPMAVLAADGRPDPAKPTVLILGQQHGNEPAGGEAALALVAELAGPRRALLERVNVLVIPRANPDGAERFVRTTRNGIDVNRDHLLLRTPEAQAIAGVVRRHPPQVVLDLHEFTVAGRWVEKFGVVQAYDALLQPATVGNLDTGIDRLARDEYEARLARVLAAAGLSSFAYHTTSPDAADKVVAMGGVQADTGRNTSGLRPAVSLLIEVRGIGLGRAHFLRRVHTQVIAAMSVLETAAEQGPQLVAAVRQAGLDTAARACRGELVVDAHLSTARQAMRFLDARTGEARAIEVDWRAATPLDVRRTRARPCGYVIHGEQRAAIERLHWLGARTQTVTQAARWVAERYVVVADDTGRRQDARGTIDDGAEAGIRVLAVRTEPVGAVVPPGSVYVGLDQPLGALIAAALEPDSQNSWAANRLLAIEQDSLLRVRAPPGAAPFRAP